MTLPPQTFHLTAVAIDGRALLIEGPSGSGKSDLALRLIDRGAKLVGDDYIELMARNGVLYARAPATIAGQIELRGLGIMTTEYMAEVPAALLVALTPTPDRLPDPGRRRLLGIDLPLLPLDPRPASAPIKVELALRRAPDIVGWGTPA